MYDLQARLARKKIVLDGREVNLSLSCCSPTPAVHLDPFYLVPVLIVIQSEIFLKEMATSWYRYGGNGGTQIRVTSIL